jgi:hypothetical protein
MHCLCSERLLHDPVYNYTNATLQQIPAFLYTLGIETSASFARLPEPVLTFPDWAQGQQQKGQAVLTSR